VHVVVTVGMIPSALGHMHRSGLCDVGTARDGANVDRFLTVVVSHRLFTGYDRKKTRIVESQ
jgi:hypothetical protein